MIQIPKIVLKKELYVLLGEIASQTVELKSFTVVNGVQCATEGGILMMQELFADN